jgi:ATP-dependent exoDNAse (exonuclease V) alpha subunit
LNRSRHPRQFPRKSITRLRRTALRRPVPLHENDMLVLDEASQIGTADLAMLGEAARQAGARVIATGDAQQFGAVEAGGHVPAAGPGGPGRAVGALRL